MVTELDEATFVDLVALVLAAFVQWIHAMMPWHDLMPSCHFKTAIFIDGAISDGSSDWNPDNGSLGFNDHAP